MALDWLNENARRAYPFVDSAAAGPYRENVLDAVFALGTDFDFDFSEETSEIRLVSVTAGVNTWILTFQYYQHSVVVPGTPSLVFTVGNDGPKHTVATATTAKSHAYLIIGDPSVFRAETPGAPLEARVITTPQGSQAQTIKVYNAERRKTITPYFVAAHGKTPGQNYEDAVDAAPTWQPNVVITASHSITGQIVKLMAGFNAVVRGSSEFSTAFISMSVGGGAGGCPLCGIYEYVQSKLGTSDYCADLNGDGTVSSADLTIAATLRVSTPGITYQGTLRTLNGVGASGGDLRITAGPQVEIEATQDTYTITIKVKEANSATNCVTGVP